MTDAVGFAVSSYGTSALTECALDGLSRMYVPATREFVQTLRGQASADGPALVPEGRNLRYAAIVALGLGDQERSHEKRVLGEDSVADLIAAAADRARTHADLGAVALCAWARAEVSEIVADDLFDRLHRAVASDAPIDTVSLAWVVTAASSAARLGLPTELAESAARRLLSAQGPRGLFPHAIPARSLGRLREHVGSFADQIYPTQALARLSAVTGDKSALAAADLTAGRLVELQGGAGQWWWHHDARTGDVVERFPVYSVHQHGMAPMVLQDLAACGGADHAAAWTLGLSWLDRHPESFDELVDLQRGVIWRKVGRREPPKAARRVSAVTTRVRPGLVLPGLDAALPVGRVDHECRPYELGWLLYAMYRAGRKDLLT